MAISSLLVLLFLLPSAALCDPPPPAFQTVPLPPPALGPEAYVFDSSGQGPYTGVADGRILEYENPDDGFREYAFSSLTRPKTCDGYIGSLLGPQCGRPLGLGFNNSTGELWIADAYFGLLVVPPGGGTATQIVTGADGVPFHLLDGLDIDQLTGVVYIVDASANFGLSGLLLAVAVNDASGRLLAYDPRTKTLKVLKEGLSGPAGVAVSDDGSYVLFTEFIAKRVQKFWLKGPKTNTSEILITLEGRPDNIKRTVNGDYLVAMNIQTLSLLFNVPTSVRIDPSGKILENISLSDRLGITLISEVQEYKERYLVGSMLINFVGVYNNTLMRSHL